MNSPSTSGAEDAPAAYWNDEEQERAKPYWVESVDDRRLLDYLEQQTHLRKCFEDALAFTHSNLSALRGVVVDLGAGVGWTSAILSRHPAIRSVQAIDYSRHRLFKIAPIVFEQFGAITAKIERHCCSMADLGTPAGSVDVVVFCQALYMSDNPVGLLRNVERILRPGGVVIVACESIEPAASAARRLARVARGLVSTSPTHWLDVIRGANPDKSGRRRYRDDDYKRFLRCAGFQVVVQNLDYRLHDDVPLLATNYFGLKRVVAF